MSFREPDDHHTELHVDLRLDRGIGMPGADAVGPGVGDLGDPRDGGVPGDLGEFLIHRECPTSIMLGYVTRTAARQAQLQQALADAGVVGAYVDVRPNWYYGYTRRRSTP